MNLWCRLDLKERVTANKIKHEKEEKQGRNLKAVFALNVSMCQNIGVCLKIKHKQGSHMLKRRIKHGQIIIVEI